MQTLLLSRKFWAALVGLVLIILTGFLPSLPDLSSPLIELTSLLSAYILGSALERAPLPAGEALHDLLRSRKFWATLSGLGLVILRALRPDFPLADEQITAIILTLSAYTFSTGLQDGLKQNQEVNHA
jgi:hypothetical protein